jgi:thiol-disulfide isomerase/thioredoxin
MIVTHAMDRNRRSFLGAAAAALAALGFGCSKAQSGLTRLAELLPSEGHVPSLGEANGWLNSEPLTGPGLRGKVVLVQFWTYTCINWLRTLPYVRAWADRYADQGLVVIGVHTPEFSFEHNVDNVRQAAQSLRVEYPIAIDNDYGIWSAFANNYWPALYFVDANGRIRHHHFGEGEYEQSERIIQQLLRDAGANNDDPGLVTVDPRGVEVAADWSAVQSPESYLGVARAQNFASPGGAARGASRVYTAPAQLRLNQWALAGNWTVEGEPAVLNEPSGRVAFQFHARDLNLVMGPAARGTSIPFRIYLDGQAPGAAHGVDVDDQGAGMLAEQRLYQLIRQSTPVVDRRFEIEFQAAGAAAYAFTFG